MGEINREGHRRRAKEKILTLPAEKLYDYQLLECLLFYSIPRIDVKPIAYSLINRFGSVDGALSASVDDLLQIDGVGENTATLIKLSKLICDKALINRNDSSKDIITNYIEATEYVRNIICSSEIEQFLVITLNNNMKIISSTIVAQGYTNHIKIEPYKIIERAVNDKATSIIIAHNHPYGQALPSKSDIELTTKIISLLAPMQIKLRDHIIVNSKECCSMSVMPEYEKFFKAMTSYNYIKEDGTDI